jgi:hypothetical protein
MATATTVVTAARFEQGLSYGGPAFENWDLALFKNVKIREPVNAQFRAESFNAFNTPEYNGPNTSFGSSSFGQITLDAHFPRYLQLERRVSY